MLKSNYASRNVIGHTSQYTSKRANEYRRILKNILDTTNTKPTRSKVKAIQGPVIHTQLDNCAVGDMFLLKDTSYAEVIAVDGVEVRLLLFDVNTRIRVGDNLIHIKKNFVGMGNEVIGRVVDAWGRPLDDKGPIYFSSRVNNGFTKRQPVFAPLIREHYITGVSAIDLFTPIGKGQKLGIFSGSGVGKSTLMGMIIRHSQADVNVVGLVGERKREVRELIEYDIGKEGLKKTVVVYSGSDQSAAQRLASIRYVLHLADYFATQGQHVGLYIDSMTRIAHAQREIGLLRGEPPAVRGFPPSLYTLMPKIVELCGARENGSITGFFNVLVEGDDLDEPISDILRGLLDGHIILDRALAEASFYPAIRITKSLSRLAQVLQEKDLYELVGRIRKAMSMYESNADILNAGVYVPGSNTLLDSFLGVQDKLEAVLVQGRDEYREYSWAVQSLAHLVREVG